MGQSADISQVAIAPRIVAATLWLCVHGCRSVDSGAVELSWVLRPASGPRLHDPTNPFVSCDSGEPNAGAVEQIRLAWHVGDVTGSSTFPCSEYTGRTGFDLPPGSALLSIAPVCATCDALPGTYIAPAPEQRDVIAGDTVILGALELIVEVSTCSPQHLCICEACSP